MMSALASHIRSIGLEEITFGKSYLEMASSIPSGQDSLYNSHLWERSVPLGNIYSALLPVLPGPGRLVEETPSHCGEMQSKRLTFCQSAHFCWMVALLLFSFSDLDLTPIFPSISHLCALQSQENVCFKWYNLAQYCLSPRTIMDT